MPACIELTIDFRHFSTAGTTVDEQAPTHRDSTLGVTNILNIVSHQAEAWESHASYLILTECEGHPFAISTYFHIDVAEGLKNLGNRVLQLIVGL